MIAQTPTTQPQAPGILEGDSVEILGRTDPQYAEILNPGAMRFITKLVREFDSRRRELLTRRERRQAEINAGKLPDFLPETHHIRQSEWTVAPIPADLRDRRVEITGPTDRKMVINALNSGAKVFMADFEDANSPTWDNIVGGQYHVRDAVRRNISFTSPEGKSYQLNKQIATLMVRPRGWHLDEKHVHVDGKPISGSLLDFGLFFYHNARDLLDRGSGPYFYLPKMESHLEARLWNDVFLFAQEELGIPRGSIRATCLIETILATFEMDEILWELREHSAGLNCGRWDYIFSFIKKFRNYPNKVLSDRALVNMTTPFMHKYTLLTIQTCHRRGIHAMGGMAAQIPIKGDPAANEAAMAKVRADKQREVNDGHDGTWVAHPGLVPVAMEEFAKMSGDNQIDRKREDVHVTTEELLAPPEHATITEQGVRTNISVGIQYLESWLRGSGCVPINNLMEDAATAEISRTQLWQWVRHCAKLTDGRQVDKALVRDLMRQELGRLRDELGAQRYDSGKFQLAGELFTRMTNSPEFPEFLTTIAYQWL